VRLRARLAILRQPQFKALRERLLTIAGREVKPAPGCFDPMIDEILKSGREMRLSISRVVMQAAHCNANVARIWRQRNATVLAMCTGYALDTDGTVWRQHWWGLTTEPRIIETTVPRSRYFGIDFTGEVADDVATEILRKVRTWRNES
jgi:hypothetical protein